MKGDVTAIKWLNTQLRNELTAINQYYLHAKMYKNWGLEKLGAHEYKESIEEMQHADKLMDHILMIEGLPNVQDMHKMMIGEDVPECLASDLALEKTGYGDLKEAIAYCESIRDFGSRDLFTKLLVDTQEHIDFLETQLELIEKVGLPNYLQSQMAVLG
ncbi:MAG: bacterioferritin [Arcobacter sp.]|nr:MAG: bacterioferritin [Arcobacter sp.]